MPAEIIDLHTRSSEGIILTDIPKEIIQGLSLPPGQKCMPITLLYDDHGLRLYDDMITKASEYYVYPAEEEIIRTRADEIVGIMHQGKGIIPGEVILELGAAALRKTGHILSSISRLVEGGSSSLPVTYYGLDLQHRELEHALGVINKSDIGRRLAGKILLKGMWGTFDDAFKFIQDGGLDNPKLFRTLAAASNRLKYAVENASPISSDSSSTESDSASDLNSPDTDARPPLHFIFLGTSLGNLPKSEAVPFLRRLPLRPGSGDTLLLGIDRDNDKDLIEAAYNDSQNYTKRFILNALKAGCRALGDEKMYDESKWEYVNRYNVAERRHEAFVKSKCVQEIYDNLTDRKITIQAGELIKMEEASKFSDGDAYAMFAEANLRVIQRWTDTKGYYSVWLLERPPFVFPLLSSPDAQKQVRQYSKTPFGVPSREEWARMWNTWDFITLKMIPPSLRFQKPIDLRHICLFYFGHIPTFLDIHLSRLLREPHTKPEQFKFIFERGMDPDVDDPTQCHSHSEVPTKDEDWPTITSILEFRMNVRARLLKVYDDIDSGKLTLNRKVGRVLFMTFEHEALHAETLLYMLLQRAGSGTIPPPGFAPPPWGSLKATWNAIPAPTSPTVTLGPATITLGHDDVEAMDGDEDLNKDIINHEFGWDNESPRRTVEVGQFRISWRPVTNGEFYQFYIKGGKDKVDLPASWVEEDGKIEVRTLYGPVSMEIAQHWPVIAPYNSLSVYAMVKGGRLPTEVELRLFLDTFDSGYEGGTNVAFRNWHPVPATTGCKKYGGKGTNGGVWEWTSTVWDKYDGFTPSKLYPGFSADFFDEKHQAVLGGGGSYATIPRTAERRTFRNWFQHNYPYAWIGGRIVYDVPQKIN